MKKLVGLTAVFCVGMLSSMEMVRPLEDATQRIPCKNLTGHTSKVNSAIFDSQGKRLATASNDTTVRLWKIEGKSAECERVLKGHTREVNSVAFNGLGDKVVSASNDATVRIWNSSGECEAILPHSCEVISARFFVDRYIITVSKDTIVRIWAYNNANWQCKITLPQALSSQMVVFPHSNKHIVEALLTSDGNNVHVWHMDELITLIDGQQQFEVPQPKILDGHTGTVRSAMCHRDQMGRRMIATASDDHTARIWVCNDNAYTCTRVLKSHVGSVNAALFSPQGDKLVTASQDMNARVWAYDGSDWKIQKWLRHDQAVAAVLFDDWHFDKVVTLTSDGVVHLWVFAVRDGGWRELLMVPGGAVSLLDKHHGCVAMTASNNSVCVWNLVEINDYITSRGPSSNHDQPASSSSFSLFWKDKEWRSGSTASYW